VQVGFALLQLVATIIVTGLLTTAGALWTGASPHTAVYVRNCGFVAAGLFAVPAIAFCLIVKLQGSRGAKLVLSRSFGRYVISVYAVFLIFMAAGFVAYPHAPIAEKSGDFLDKFGRPYSYLQFERFTLWESSFGLVGASMLVGTLAALPASIAKQVGASA